MFEVDGWHKHGEKDHYQHGCDPDDYVSFGGNDRFSAPTIPDLLVKLRAFVGVDDDYEIELDACDDEGRVDIQVLETNDSYVATERQIEEWKRGELDLWCSTYTFVVQEVIRRGVVLSVRLNDE